MPEDNQQIDPNSPMGQAMAARQRTQPDDQATPTIDPNSTMGQVMAARRKGGASTPESEAPQSHPQYPAESPMGRVLAARGQAAPSDGGGNDESERMGEGQSWVTRPLQTYAGIGEYRKGAGPIERGIEKFGSGLLSPLSLGLMVVTGGLGGLAEGGAATAGEEVATSLAGRAGQAALSKLAPEVAAKVATASGVVSKLANVGFTGQQIYSLAKDSPQLKDAIAAGDYDKAQELGISMLLNGTLAGLSTAHLIKGINKSDVPVWTKDKEVIAASQQPQHQAGADALKFRKANETLIRDTPLDMAAQLYHEAGGDATVLERWRQEVVDDNNIKPALQEKYDALLKRAQNLPPEVRQLSAELRLQYAKDLAELKAGGKFHPNSPGQPNYAGQHRYVPDDEGSSAVEAPGSSMRTRLTKTADFEKRRSFDTLVDALKAGYKPKDIGLAGSREQYIRDFGGKRGGVNAEKTAMKQTVEDGRKLAYDPAKARVRAGRLSVPVEPGDEVGDMGERRADSATRQRIDEMTPDERERELARLRTPPDAPVGPPAPIGEAQTRPYRPEDFIRRAVGAADPAAVKAAVLKEGADDIQIQTLRDAYKAGGKIEPVLVHIDKGGNVIDASGIHRAYAAMQAGIEKIPVAVRRINEERAPNVEPIPGKWPTELDPTTDSQILGKAVAEITGSGTLKFDDLAQYPKTRARIIRRALEMKTEEKTKNSPTATATRKPSVAPNGARAFMFNGKLYYDISDYKPGPDLFSSFRVKGTNAEGGPNFERANALVHPDYHEQVMQAFQDSSWFRKNPIMRGLLGASTQAKKSLLTLSPFHWTTEYLRGIQMGLGPLEALRPGELTPDRLALKSKFPPSFSVGEQRSLAAEGAATNTHLVNKIPGLGKFMSNAEEKLFGGGGYIDRLKADSWEKVVGQLTKRHQNWTTDQIHFASSKIVDAAFGGLNWKMLGASMNGVDALRLIALAPDFTGSQILFAKYGLQPGGSVVGQSLMRIALYNFGVARVLNMLTTGSPRLEHPFSVVSPDEKKTFSMRTMPEDIAHALTDPRGYIYNRLNPLLVRTAVEGVTGKDEKGKSVTYEKELHDLLRNMLPISGQNLIPTFRREDEGIGTSLLRSAGFASEPNTTTAYKLAGKLASDRSESGPVDQDKLDRHHFVMQMEDSLRNGTIKPQDLNEASKHKTLSPDELDQIWNNYKETQRGADGKPMNEYTARLYTRATRLPMREFLQVYDIATTPEKKILLPLLEKKGKAYLKKAQKSMVDTQREQDPTYQRLWRDIGHVPLW